MTSPNTYEELYQILSLMNKATVMKIPVDILNTIKEKRNPDYQTKIDKNDIFNEKNVNKETIDILCYLDYHYWMDKDEKAKVDRIKKQRFQEKENEKREKYNPNDIFKKVKEDETIVNNDDTSVIEYKEAVWKKLKKFIFKILHIRK